MPIGNINNNNKNNNNNNNNNNPLLAAPLFPRLELSWQPEEMSHFCVLSSRGLAPCEFELQCLSDGCGSLLPALEPTTLYVRLQLC